MTAPGSCMIWCRRRWTNSREGKMSAHSLRPIFLRMRFPRGCFPLPDERSGAAGDFSGAREEILVMRPLVSMLKIGVGRNHLGNPEPAADGLILAAAESCARA